MKLLSRSIGFILVVFFASCVNNKTIEHEEKEPGSFVSFVEKKSDKRVDVMIDGELFTSYQWPDDVMKPILYPVITSNGTEITRGFPLNPKPGERYDHPHHVGIWLNYGNVNGLDFWGNSYEIPDEIRNTTMGSIKHLEIEQLSDGVDKGSMVTNSSWIDPQGKELLSEKTEYHFLVKGSARIIDRITTLKATGSENVIMNDTKEGMFGIRVARQLELPSDAAVSLTNDQGDPSAVKAVSNEGVSGNYRSSEGVTGTKVWGKRAKWMELSGIIDDEKISVVIIDHPQNIGFPTYWHARSYGLFAANPFGWKDFTKGEEELNFSISAGASTTLKYRVIVNSGATLTEPEINAFLEDFASKY